MIDWSQISNDDLREELQRRNLVDAGVVGTEVMIKELRSRFEEIVICFYPPPALKGDYRSRVLYTGSPARLCYLLYATAHDLMMDDGMIHSDRDRDDQIPPM